MFNKRVKIREVLSWEPQSQEVIVMGWVRTFRNNQFIALNDGSTNTNLQVVAELGLLDDSRTQTNFYRRFAKSNRPGDTIARERTKAGSESHQHRSAR